jgi:hypothetical protein
MVEANKHIKNYIKKRYSVEIINFKGFFVGVDKLVVSFDNSLFIYDNKKKKKYFYNTKNNKTKLLSVKHNLYK